MLVETHFEEPVVTLTLNRADKRNALDGALMRDLAAALDGVRDDPRVRVIVLRGRGPVFSSGIDHHFLLEIFQKSETAPFKHLHHDLQEVFHRIERMERPVIAALHGCCVGMAFELALACDFRIATTDCVLGLPEIAFGIVPDVGGTTRLVRLVGLQHARSLLLTGRLVGAPRGFAMGLVDEVVEGTSALDAAVAALVGRLAVHPAAAVGKMKTLLHASLEVDARTSFQLEGLVQEVLMRRPDLASHFPQALAFIRDGMRNPG